MKKSVIAILLTIPLLAACSSLTLKPVSFGWSVENVLKADSQGNVEEQRHSISFNVTPVFKAEFGDSTNADSKEVRVIRNNEGYYFIAAKEFKNIYVFGSGNGSMVLENKILVTEEGLQNPVFNQRNTYVELIDGNSIYELTSKGIIKR